MGCEGSVKMDTRVKAASSAVNCAPATLVSSLIGVVGVNPSRLPSFSDGGESIGEDRLLGEHGDEALAERGQLLFGHVRHEIVEHGALAEQRVGAAFGGV